MRTSYSVAALAMWTLSLLHGAPGMTAPDLTVGRNLQMWAAVGLTEAAPETGLQIVLTSDDPKRLLLSKSESQPGSPSITVTVQRGRTASNEFWLQALGDHGNVTYTASAPHIGSAKGTVTLAPSAIAIVGPFRLPSFPTTPRTQPAKISLYTVALDASMKFLEQQAVAGGTQVAVAIANSNPEAGAVGAAELTFRGGESDVATYFQPAAEGRTTLTPTVPPGFSTPAEFATVIASVEKPGLAVSDELTVGKNLQVPGVLCLGETPGPEGLTVSLTSSDPSRLLLSKNKDELGSGTIEFELKAGELTAQYYLQALSDSGLITYKAMASGFRSRIGQVALSPSGIIVAYSRYGPPDEAAVLRNTGAQEDRRFYASLAQEKKEPIYVVAWSVHLDLKTGLAADITVQDLRPGIAATVELKSSNPAVGTVESPLTIQSGSNHMAGRFTPLARGETIIAVSTPAGFATPANATAVPAVVIE